MSNDHPIAPPQPRRVSSGQRADEKRGVGRPERIARISSGERAEQANGGHSTTPAPARRLVRRTTTLRP